MDSWPRVAVLVDIAAAAEVCQSVDDSLLGCLQLLREIQAENRSSELAISYGLFDSTRDLDQLQLQGFIRQQNYCGQSNYAKQDHNLTSMSSWHPWDMNTWAKFRKNVLEAISACGRQKEFACSPMKTVVVNDENSLNQKSQPLIQRCLSHVNSDNTESPIHICIVGLFPSDDSGWREWLGVSSNARHDAVNAGFITSWLGSFVPLAKIQWRLVECKAQCGIQAALQMSANCAVRLLSAATSSAKAVHYNQLCSNSFHAPSTVAASHAMATIVHKVNLAVNEYPGLAGRGDWQPNRRKNLIQHMVMYSTVDAKQLEQCCSQIFGKLSLSTSQHQPQSVALQNWAGTLQAANLAVVGIATQDSVEIPVWLLAKSSNELQVAMMRVGTGQTPLLVNAIKQSRLFSSNGTMLSLMKPPAQIAATLRTTSKKVPLQEHQPQDCDKMSSTRATRGMVLLKRGDSALSAPGLESPPREAADNAETTLHEIDQVLNQEGANISASTSKCMTLMEDSVFVKELGLRLTAQLQQQPFGPVSNMVQSCVLDGKPEPLVVAQALTTQAHHDKNVVRQVSDAIMALYAPITKKFMGRCSAAERALLARCCILQLLHLFESACTSKKSRQSKALKSSLSKSARNRASRAIVKLATNLNAANFNSTTMLFAVSDATTKFGTIQATCNYLQRQYGAILGDVVNDVCSEVDDSFSKPKPETAPKVAASLPVDRPSKLKLLPDSDDGDQDPCHSMVAEQLFMDDQDSNWFSVLSQGSDTNMSDSVSKARKRLFDDDDEQTATPRRVKNRKSYPPSSRDRQPIAPSEAVPTDAPATLQALMTRTTISSRGGFAASRQQVGAYQVRQSKLAVQKKLHRSHSLPARSRELLARSQAAAHQANQSSTVAETPLIKRRRS